MQFINYRLRVTISSSRTLVGQFLAFDRHMNIVLADCEEYRKLKPKKGPSRRHTFCLTLSRSRLSVSLCASPLLP